MHEEHPQQVQQQGFHHAFCIFADVLCGASAQQKAGGKGQQQGGQLEDAMGEDAGEIHRQRSAVVEEIRGKHAQDQGVGAQRQCRQIEEGDEAVQDADAAGPQVVAEQGQQVDAVLGDDVVGFQQLLEVIDNELRNIPVKMPRAKDSSAMMTKAAAVISRASPSSSR